MPQGSAPGAAGPGGLQLIDIHIPRPVLPARLGRGPTAAGWKDRGRACSGQVNYYQAVRWSWDINLAFFNVAVVNHRQPCILFISGCRHPIDQGSITSKRSVGNPPLSRRNQAIQGNP
ncbi:MAG: hypothetical protein JW709_06995 [Sedimentisphaerales bacterium]|nr:hypothetical protein [Sedimentisphaerales bacterium]